MLLFVIFDEKKKKKKKNRIGVWFSCNFSGFLAIGTYIVTYGAGEKSCCQWCRFSYLWCYCFWWSLVIKSKSSCQWCTLAFGLRRLIRVFTVCLQEFLSKYDRNEKSTSDTPEMKNGLVQLIRMGKSIRQIWVKHFKSCLLCLHPVLSLTFSDYPTFA